MKPQKNRDYSKQSTILAKLPGTILALGLYYALPLYNRPQLIIRPWLLIPVLVCTVVFLTQPGTSKEQFKQQQDQHSMKYISLATIFSQVSIVVEWGYFRTNHTLTWHWTAWVGLLLMGGGLALRIWAIHLLKECFTNPIIIRPDHQLIQAGPYKVIRHPSYTGAYLVAIGIGVFLRAGTGTIITSVVLLAAYAYRIRKEEAAMLDKFGDIYRKYQKQTRKMFPGIW